VLLHKHDGSSTVAMIKSLFASSKDSSPQAKVRLLLSPSERTRQIMASKGPRRGREDLV
jgi:hypothetical protein